MPAAEPFPTVLYLHQYFRTPAEGGALRSWFVAEELTRQGARVEMITAHDRPTYERRVFGERLTVHYLPVPYANAFGPLARVRAFLAYGWGALRLAGRLVGEVAGLKVCFATSTPLTVGVVARLLCAWRGVAYVFEVRDLWPEAPIQLGYVRAAPLRWLLRGLERWIYEGARHIVALSPGMVAGVCATGTATPTTLVPNMADTAAFQPAFAGTGGSAESFVILYAGALGRANRVTFLLDAAEATHRAGLSAVRFVVAGSGAEAEHLRMEVTQRALPNVRLVGTLDRAGIQAWRARAAASFTCFDVVPVLDTTSPNKFFEGLAAGALSITTTRGWLRELVETHQCGFGYDPRQPAEFVAKLRPLVADRARLRLAQENARRLAETAFRRETLAAAVAGLILQP
ncbi:MAG: glycosyltransferase family 4 protein [Hymenobacteraceae bacterium]|nr:glycosyltransferase family 4 protein [Hymenobacteraceae bacterium]